MKVAGDHARWCGADYVARFWAKVNKGPHPKGCWIWEGAKNEWGYGMVTMHRRKNQRAHRVAYEMANGAIPPGKLVLHTCDNPDCVRHDHLSLGDDATNNRDMRAKGRSASTLNAENVRFIRSAFQGVTGKRACGALNRQLADRFGVGHKTIWEVRTGRKWTDVT